MLHSLCRSLVISGAALLLCAAGPAVAGSDCATFAGLEHCALGTAGVESAGEVLRVSDVGPEGSDGVAVTLPDATDWQAAIRFSDGDSSPRITLGALAGGEEISRAELATSDDGTIGLSATFTGSDGPASYSVLVYRDGFLVGSQGGVSSNRLIRLDQWMDWLWDLWHLIGFHQRAVGGACVWTFGLPEAVRVTLPDGVKVEGDEVHLVEEVGSGAGHYPYVAFDGITLRSSRDLEIGSEEVH